MSTNHYLHRPSRPCGECGHERNEPTELHIGKSSAGWVWLWRGYHDDGPPGVALTSPSEWFAYLALEIDKGAEIRTEYHSPCSLANLKAFIESKRVGSRRNSHARNVDGDDVSYNDFI